MAWLPAAIGNLLLLLFMFFIWPNQSVILERYEIACNSTNSSNDDFSAYVRCHLCQMIVTEAKEIHKEGFRYFEIFVELLSNEPNCTQSFRHFHQKLARQCEKLSALQELCHCFLETHMNVIDDDVHQGIHPYAGLDAQYY